MTVVKTSIEIEAPPEQVWKVVMDPGHYDDWVTIHRRLGHVDAGELRPGFQFEQTLCLHHANFKVRWRLSELDAPYHAVWEGKGPAGSQAKIVEQLEALDGGDRTRFDYVNEYDQPGGFLGRMAGRVLVAGVAQKEANRSLQLLKKLVER